MKLTAEKNIILLLFIYIFSILFICSKMSPLYVTNEWADPNIYFNVAKGMINGRALYTEIFDHKGPLIFFIYGAGYLISNDTFIGLFIIELISWYLLALSLYFIARYYLNKSTSFLIVMTFFVFLVKSMKAGGSAEEFILCMEGISLYLFIKYFNGNTPLHKPKYMIVHATLVTAVMFTKINLIVFWFFPLLAVFVTILKNKEYKNFFYNVLAYVLGTIIICIPIIGYLYTHNDLEEAFKIYIELNRAYAKLGAPTNIVLRLIARILYLFLEPTSLFFLGSIGIFFFSFKYIKNNLAKWAIPLSGLILYTVIFIGKFQYYYPIPYLIFAFLGLLYLVLYFKKYCISFNLTTKKSLIVSLVFFIFICTSMTGLDNTRIEEWIFHDQYEDRKTLMTNKLRKEIMKEKNPTLLNLGFGLANNLFTTCNIVPNVKYFVTPNISHSFYPELRNEQFQYLKDKKTDFVIIQQYIPSTGKYLGKDSIDNPYILKNLPVLKENYNLILSDTIINYIDERSVDVYFLYKKKK